jgi:hypothetical protein
MVAVRRAWSVVGAALACVALPPVARAEPTRSQVVFGLDYQSAPGLTCPNAGEFRQALAERLGYDPFASESKADDYRVRIALTRAGDAVVAYIDWVDRAGRSEGERRLSSERGDCAELTRGVVFAVAVQIQLRAAEAPEVVSVEPEPDPPPVTKPSPEVREPPPPPPPPPRPQRDEFLLLGVGPTFSRGWLPGTAGSLQVLGMAARDYASIEFGVNVALPNTQTDRGGAAFEARSLVAFVAPCARFQPLGVCAVAAFGRLAVEGRGVDRPLSPASGLAGVGGRLELLLPVFSRVAVLAHGGALASLTRREVVLNGAPVWSTAPMVFEAGLDAALIFR